MAEAASVLYPDWPAPANVRCLVTTRHAPEGAGHSEGNFRAFNLGMRVGDKPEAVWSNHRLLEDFMAAGPAPLWLNQVHGKRVVRLGEAAGNGTQEGDGWYLSERGRPCGILTADCMPVFFTVDSGAEAALAHAGWRGLAGGVLENAVANFEAQPRRIIAWLGPGIGPCHFEVGSEVREIFLASSDRSASAAVAAAFKPGEVKGKWMADLYELARLRLRAAGLSRIYGGGFCSYCDAHRFYSYRRDGVTGRFASLIWLA